MNSRERFLNALNKKDVDRTPIWIMRQAGRYLGEYRKLREKHSFKEMCKNPELAASVTLLPFKYASLDGAIIFADILLPLECFGISFDFKEDGKPVIDGSCEMILNAPAVDVEDKLGFIKETIKIVRSEKKDCAVIGFSGAPFTLMSYIIEGGWSPDFTKTRTFAMKEKEIWKKAMEKLSDVIADYLIMQAEAGADVVQLFDSWAGCLSPMEYRAFVKKYNRGIIERVERCVPLIHFSTCSAGILRDISEAGGRVIGIDWRIDIDEGWKVVGEEKCIQGNLDPAVLLAGKEEIERGVKEILNRAGGRNGHIFNLGHGILPHTPVENMQFLVETVHRLSER